ncbi:MAG: WecB/TagA/CpsF family glycosyltransferase [Candidatus Peregrinibacteria bacterium]|nr:WecB/TagA/CpsF family glycosyltransferase [Candidatus Peregrinibacteria bacterium]
MVKIFDIPISVLKFSEAAEKFCDFDQNSERRFAATPNAEILLKSLDNSELKDFLQKCDFNFADSVSVQWAAEVEEKKWAKWRAVMELLALPVRKKWWTAIPERISGADIFEKICEVASKKGQKIFLIGGMPNAAAKSVKILQLKFPEIKVDFFDGKVDAENEEMIVQKMNEFGAQIVFTPLGSPKQELFLAKNMSKVPTAKIGMGIGGTLDFFAGEIERAPEWMRKWGMEWAFRLVKEPRRIGRIWQAVIAFPIKVLTI